MKIFNTLTAKEKKLAKIVRIKKGHILFREEDKCKYLGIVIKGNLSITSFTLLGHEIIYNTLKDNEMFGNNLLFSKNPYYKGDVSANEDSEVALLKKEDVLYLLKNNNSFLNHFLSANSENSIKLNSKIKLLSLESAEDRFIYYMDMNDNEITFDSITSLAKELSLQRETLSRLISKMEKKGQIIKKDHSISMK